MSILKRLDMHVPKGKKEEGIGGKQNCNSVMVKIFSCHISGDMDALDYVNQSEESDGNFDDGRSTKSKSKVALSHISHKSKADEKHKREKALAKDLQEEIDNNPDSTKYQYCLETFRISKITDIKLFHRLCCEHWGLEIKDFNFYDDNGDILDAEDLGKNGTRSVEKVMETVLVREFKDKDLFPPGPRIAMLYLGTAGFEEKYKKVMGLKREKMEDERQNLKF